MNIQLTESSLEEVFDLDDKTLPIILSARVDDNHSIGLEEREIIEISGRFTWRLPGNKSRNDSPFKLFLEQGEKGQSWSLVKPIEPVGSIAGKFDNWARYLLLTEESLSES